MLTFVGLSEKRGDNNRLFGIFKCDCGNEKSYPVGRIVNNGYKTDCGCRANNKPNLKHGFKGASVYFTWQSIKTRCLNKNSKDYNKYGAKGIKMDKEWENSFEAFYRDMGDRPNGKTIDRIDNTKGYFKENCRWATSRQQQINKSNSWYVHICGTTYDSIHAAAAAHNVTTTTIVRWCDGYTDKRRLNHKSKGIGKPKLGCWRWSKY